MRLKCSSLPIEVPPTPTEISANIGAYFSSRSRDSDLSALDFIRQTSEDLATTLHFVSAPDAGTRRFTANLPQDLRSYLIEEITGGIHQATAWHPFPEEFGPDQLYTGTDASMAVTWCRIHAQWGGCHDIDFGETTAEIATAGQYLAWRQGQAEKWLLATLYDEQLGAWDSLLQAELVAKMHHVTTA